MNLAFLKKILKKKRVLIPLLFVLILVSLFGYFYVRARTAPPVFESVKAVRKDIVHEVSVTGRIEPIDRIDLSFLASGRIKGLLVKEGDEVKAGTTLAYLDAGALNASIAESHDAFLQAQRQLDEIKKGTRPESIAVSDATAEAAHTAVTTAQEALEREIERSYVVAHSTVQENADGLFENANGPTASFGITFSSGGVSYTISAPSDIKAGLEDMRRALNDRFVTWQALSSDIGRPIQARTQEALDGLTSVQNFLTALSGALSRYSAQSAQDSSVYAPFQTSIAGARSTISGLITELLTARQAYEAKETSFAVAQRQSDLAKADPTRESVAVQEAAVARARQSVGVVSAQLQNVAIVAPIDGVVTGITAQVGETESPGAPVLTLISKGVFELVAYIPEADIVNVHVGQEAQVTFDALDLSTPMHATVVNVSPGETMKEGVATYKTVLYLDNANPQLLSGMSANIDIKTDSRSNVIVIPNRSVIRENSREYVKIHNSDNTFVERDIKTGLKGSDGMVEVTDGLTEGDDVVLFIEEKK